MADITTVADKVTSIGALIGKVTVQPETVAPGQPVLVQVLDPLGQVISDPAITVIIQGGPASSRYYQFAAVGTHKLFVSATKGALSETAQALVTVAGSALAFRKTLTLPVVAEIPILQVATVLGQPYAANFSLGITPGGRRLAAAAVAKASTPPPASPSKAPTTPPVIKKTGATATTAAPTSQPAPEATSYHWDFGDGSAATTQTPTASHDYFPAIQADDFVRGFDVTCTVTHDNITVKRTLLLHSSYGMIRQSGIVVPPVTGSTQNATFQHIAFSASLIVHNLESSPITITAAAIVPFGDDSTVVLPAPKFTAMKTPVVVDAKSASALGVYAPLAQLQLDGNVVNGFTVHYSGDMKDSSGTPVPVRFSYAFRILLSDSGLVNAGPAPQLTPANWDLGAALQAVTAKVAGPKGAVSKAGGQTVDSATNTVVIALSADPANLNTLAQVRSAIEAGLTSIALKNGAINAKGVPMQLPRPASSPTTKKVELITIDPLNPPEVAAGNQCYPDDITDADLATAAKGQLVCQLTSDTETATIPSQFQNAQQGDIILSPAPSGTGDMIAEMFKVLTPPQHHSHSGMMTANFFEITHNTCVASRVSANLNTVLGIPTNIQPDVLEYGWPGSLTQSIDDATNEVYLADPGGTAYSFNSFDTDQQGDPFSLIYPLVLKPLPENESTVRPLLRKAADTARSKGAQYEPGGTQDKPATLKQKGGCYYSFYAYTDPQLSEGFADAAGADAGWAAGLSPGVCSSFCWMSLKANGIPLVTKDQFEKLSDFSQSAIAGGAQVGSATLDGLTFYPQAERAAGGQALYQVLMEQALNAEDGFGTLFGGGVNDLIAGPIANQLLNEFASGNPNLQSSAWQTPGDANAVSPDNIRLWNPPYYGYSEPLQYLPAHPEQYTISKWTKVISWGSIKGTVRNSGTAVANAHVWVFDNPGGDTYTGSDGSYTLDHVPIGKYGLKASAVTTTDGVQGERNNGNEGQPVTLTADKPNIVQDIDLRGQLDSFRRADIVYHLNGDHSDRYGGQTTGVEAQGPYTNSVDVEPGTKINFFQYKYDYAGGGYYNVLFFWSIFLQDDNSIKVFFFAVMNSDNTGSDKVASNPWTATVPPGKSVSANFQDLAYSYDGVFTSYTNGPVNYGFTVTNNQQTG